MLVLGGGGGMCVILVLKKIIEGKNKDIRKI